MPTMMTWNDLALAIATMPPASRNDFAEIVVDPAHANEDKNGPNGQITVSVGSLVPYFHHEANYGHELLSIAPDGASLAISTTEAQAMDHS